MRCPFRLMLTMAAAWAHADAHPGGGFVAGFLHPINGLDHVVAMVVVGLWGADRTCLDRLPLLLPAELMLPQVCSAVVAAVGLLVALEVRLRPPAC